MASVHYERQLFKSTKIYGHIGVGIYGAKQLRPTIPFGVNYLLPIDKSKSFIDTILSCLWTSYLWFAKWEKDWFSYGQY